MNLCDRRYKAEDRDQKIIWKLVDSRPLLATTLYHILMLCRVPELNGLVE